MAPVGEYVTFVVRLSRADSGRLDGLVERVRTGEKARFHDLEALGPLIAGMLAGPEEPSQPSTDTTRRRR